MMNISERVLQNVSELQEIGKQIEEQQIQEGVQACLRAKRIFFSGMGRSGNMVKALAIRFMHLGYDAYVAGDASTPSIEKGDLLIAVTASAKTKVTLNHMEVAKKAGAEVLLMTALLDNPGLSDCYICIPAKTKVPSVQHAGSLFEQSVLVIGDAMSAAIQKEKQIATEYMNERHANLQ